MAEDSPIPDSNDDEPGEIPRWVYMLGIIAIVVIIVFIIIHFSFGGPGAGYATAMNMSPSLRKFALIAHVTSTVGWLGAIVSFLALAIAALTSQDVQLVRGAFLAMQVDRLVRACALVCRYAGNRIRHVIGHIVGLVPALLGAGEICNNHPGCNHLVHVHTNARSIGCAGPRHLIAHRCSKKSFSRSALRARCAGTTREHNIVRIQAERDDEIWTT